MNQGLTSDLTKSFAQSYPQAGFQKMDFNCAKVLSLCTPSYCLQAGLFGHSSLFP